MSQSSMDPHSSTSTSSPTIYTSKSSTTSSSSSITPLSSTSTSLPSAEMPNRTTISDNISQIITWTLNHISFHALKTLIDLEIQFPVIGSVSSSSERLDFFTEMINMACNTSYSKNTICAIHNVIIMNDLVKKELLDKVDINELLNQYKTSNKVNSSHQDKNLIHIMPFTNVCVNLNCQEQNLDMLFSRTGHIAHLSSMQPCSIYTGTCKRCKCIYGPSSILDPHTNQRIISVQSIQNKNYVYFSGDLVYSKQLLTTFSNNLIHAHTTFEGFAESYVSTLIDLNAQQTPKYSGNTFAKRLEVVWLYYELSRFIFVTSGEKSVSFPKSFQPEARSIFIERSLPFLFHIFTVFWSNHHMIDGIKCKEELCSRVMLIDGHQKCKRVICQFENVTNMNHSEMGPVVQGCPYAPKRSKKHEKTRGRSFYFHFYYIE